jgi:hypothetical protein
MIADRLVVRVLWVPIALCLCCPAIESQAFAQGKGCDDEIRRAAGKYYPGYLVVGLDGLDPDLRQYLAAIDHRQEPGCVKGDFDGDGTQDYALLLRKQIDETTTERLVVLLGRADGSFTPVSLEILKDRLGSFYIRPLPPGKIGKWAEVEGSKRESMTLEHPGIELVLYEAASRAYFWSNGKFHSVQTSD